jgi:hypothetical protein
MSAQAIRTNGVGKTSDYHLNLTRSLAEVWAKQPPREYANAWLPRYERRPTIMSVKRSQQ